jgi:RNA polymerase sigma-70 factor (ECF subfamily)
VGVHADLVARARRGDHDAFEALVDSHYDRLVGIARRILRDAHAAEDAVQDALVHAWRNLRGLRDPARFEAWLGRLLINACRDQVRRARRRPIEVRIETFDRATGDDQARLADRDALERAFLGLPVDQRAALVLTHYLGYNAAEVADLLNVPQGTVYSRLHYGAAAMRAALVTRPVASNPQPEHVQ